MKKAILLLAFTLLTLTGAFAQRFAYVDSDFILKHMPEYASAQKQIEALSVQWQKEVDQRFQEIDRLYKAYSADQVLMTADMKKRREAEIADKEKTPNNKQTKKKNTIIKPVQDKMAKTIQAVAENESLKMIFDKNSEVMMLY